MADDILDSTGTDNEFMLQLKQAQSFFTNIDSYKKFYSAELSKIDLERNDILHYLELREKMSGAELLKAACALRKICHKRRSIKNKIELIGIFGGHIRAKDKSVIPYIKDPFKNYDELSYHVRTNILKEVFGYDKSLLKKEKKPE